MSPAAAAGLGAGVGSAAAMLQEQPQLVPAADIAVAPLALPVATTAAPAPAAPTTVAALHASTAVPAVPSIISSTSKTVSVVTSIRRPGAPLPPGSSSQPPDGSTTLSGSLDFGAAALHQPGGCTPLPVAQAETKMQQEGRRLEPDAEEKQQPEDQQVLDDEHNKCLPGAEPQSVTASGSEGSDAAGSAGHSSDAHEALVDVDLPALPEAPASTSRSFDSSSPLSSTGTSANGSAASDEMPARPAAAAAAAQAEQPAASVVASADAAARGSEQSEGAAEQSVDSYSADSDFEGSHVEISYGDQYGSLPSSRRHSSAASQQPGLAAAAAAASSGSEPASHTQQAGEQAASGEAVLAAAASPSPPPSETRAGLTGSSPRPSISHSQPEQTPRQQLQRPRSPLHAMDDRYPGSRPTSAGELLASGSSLQRLGSGGSRPLSPASQPSSRRATGDGSCSRPGSPAGAGPAAARLTSAAEAAGRVSQQEASEQLSSASSPRESSSASDSPYALLRFGTEPEEGAAGNAEAAPGAPGSPDIDAPAEAAGSPPGTPVLLSPADADAASCPGSARVEDATVVQTGGLHSILAMQHTAGPACSTQQGWACPIPAACGILTASAELKLAPLCLASLQRSTCAGILGRCWSIFGSSGPRRLPRGRRSRWVRGTALPPQPPPRLACLHCPQTRRGGCVACFLRTHLLPFVQV